MGALSLGGALGRRGSARGQRGDGGELPAKRFQHVGRSAEQVIHSGVEAVVVVPAEGGNEFCDLFGTHFTSSFGS